jgi:tetratricopeptide (TPR) repeat protein
MKPSFFLLVLSVLLFSATPHHFTHPEFVIRQSYFPPSEAKDIFDKAVLMLHNFEYDDAAELFIKVQEKDPGYALAYWGEAMTYDHPVWGDLDIEKARAALAKLGATPQDREEKSKSELEKDLMRSVEILFGAGSKPDRQKKYSEFLATLTKKYPDNIEVSAFYGLSLLGIKKGWSEWEEYNEQAAKISEAILKTDPDHPGALHYLVHANDHPAHAKDGLDAANRYAIAASYAGHALHMPSHIYLALGMWDDVVRSNEVSWKASVDHKEQKKLNNDDYSYHSHLWLQYGYLQQGRFDRAETLLENQIRYTNELPSAAARVHLVQMRGHYLLETNDWSSPFADLSIKTDDVMIITHFNNTLIDGFKAFRDRNINKLEIIASEATKAIADETQLQKANEKMTICGVTRFVKAVPTEQDIKFSTNQLRKIQAMLSWLKNDLAQAENYFKQSLPKEGAVVIGPPFNLISGHELYAEFLLANNRPDEAYQHFEKALLASPNRIMALKGQLKAAQKMKDTKKISEVRKVLAHNLRNANEQAKQDM